MLKPGCGQGAKILQRGPLTGKQIVAGVDRYPERSVVSGKLQVRLAVVAPRMLARVGGRIVVGVSTIKT